jgi:hypothetical protein
LNDYCRGALECLAWVQNLMGEFDPGRPETWRKVRDEVDSAKEDILSGVAVDFRTRLRLGR